jgi:hypothetical protein
MNEKKPSVDVINKFGLRLIGLASMAILCSLPCKGQTNAVCAPIRFFAPPVELRTQLAPEPGKPVQTTIAQADLPAEHERVTVKSLLDDEELDSPIFRHAQAYLKHLEAPSDTPVARFVDKVFRPEVIHLGKASLSCPIVTVVKQKSPLCLLSGFATDPTLSGEGGIAFKLIDLSW